MTTPQQLGTVSTAGHWEQDQKGTFAIVSGGYVVVGRRGDKKNFHVDAVEHCLVQNLESSPKLSAFIKENLGPEVLKQVQTKVDIILDIRKKAALATGVIKD